jgi:hypothetical protein
MNPLIPSRWLLGAALSLLALIGHGSGAVNLDGLNPLMLSGCAHDPSKRLTIHHLDQSQKSITIKTRHWVALELKDGSTTQGYFVGKSPPHITLSTLRGQSWLVPMSAIQSIRLRTPRDGWKYIGYGSLIGAVPASLIGGGMMYSILGHLGGGNTPLNFVGGAIVCAPLGAVPGAALGGVISIFDGASQDLDLESTWELR